MHHNSLKLMGEFLQTLSDDKELNILDIGSRVVDGQESLGSYKQFINPKWKYTGIDTEQGNNVDLVLNEGYLFPFIDDYFDIVISGQTIEHVEYPWVWFLEMSRVLKKGGLCCIIAPAKIKEHRFPIDTYRYYPDGMRALAKWASLDVVEVRKTEANKDMEDTILIARK